MRFAGFILAMAMAWQHAEQNWKPWQCAGCSAVESAPHTPHKWLNAGERVAWNGVDRYPVSAWQSQRCIAHDEIRIRESK